MSAPLTALAVNVVGRIPLRYGDVINGCQPLSEVNVYANDCGWLHAEPVQPPMYMTGYGVGLLPPDGIARIISVRERIVTWR